MNRLYKNRKKYNPEHFLFNFLILFNYLNVPMLMDSVEIDIDFLVSRAQVAPMYTNIHSRRLLWLKLVLRWINFLNADMDDFLVSFDMNAIHTICQRSLNKNGIKKFQLLKIRKFQKTIKKIIVLTNFFYK